jgi:hypothetical protein
MKQTLWQVADKVRRAAAVVESWYDPPLGSDARPLEIRQAIIEDIEHRVEPSGAGRRTLPHALVSAVVVAAEKNDRARLQAGLAGLREAVCARLEEIQCGIPHGFTIDIRYVKQPRADWAPDQRFALEYSDIGDVPAAAPPPGPPRILVTVLRGQALQSSYSLAEPHVRIGRGPAPVDRAGRPRMNDIVFVEDGDEHSRTVGRAHASIHFDAARREYRLFDDGSHNGTRIVRSGTTFDVRPHDPVGVALKAGDEIQLGTAAMTVSIERE